MGRSFESYLKLENKTNTTIIYTDVWGLYERDWNGWDSQSRPDRNFQRVRLRPNESYLKRAEVNRGGGGSPFNMKVSFENGLEDVFQINQKYAIGKAQANFKHTQRSHDITYEREGGKTLKITIRNTTQQLNNEKVEQLKKQAENYHTQKKYSEAVKKYDEALAVANDQTSIAAIKNGKSEALMQLGNFALETGLNLENQLKSDEAMKEYNNAKIYFENVAKVGVKDCKNDIEVVNAKIEGSKLFNQATSLQEVAFELYRENASLGDKILYKKIKIKYMEALNKYEEAKKLFDHGAVLNSKMFVDSIEIVNEAIEDIKDTIETVTAYELKSNFKNVSIASNNKNDEANNAGKENVNVYNQID